MKFHKAEVVVDLYVWCCILCQYPRISCIKNNCGLAVFVNLLGGGGGLYIGGDNTAEVRSGVLGIKYCEQRVERGGEGGLGVGVLVGRMEALGIRGQWIGEVIPGGLCWRWMMRSPGCISWSFCPDCIIG